MIAKEKMTGSSQYREVFDKASTSAAIAPPVPATPASACLPPRLLQDIDPARIQELVDNAAWWGQVKHDGDRVQLHATDNGITLFSGRSAKTRNCPAQIAAACAGLRAILDGELVGQTLWVFDLLSVDGRDCREASYEARYTILDALVELLACPAIHLVASAMGWRAKAVLIVNARAEHCEGVVFINALARYEGGRPNKGGNNLRWKFTASASVIVSAGGNDKRSVDIELADGTRIGSCSIPVNREIPPAGAVIECAYLYAIGSLVQARYKGIRTDVPREACTRAQLQFKDGVDPRRDRRA